MTRKDRVKNSQMLHWICEVVSEKQKNRHFVSRNVERRSVLYPGFRSQRQHFTVFNSKDTVHVDMLQRGKHINSRY